ncbi:hypothetical protein AAL_02243 [Moelleriella libera RCEF 2490]|uniref:Uncharacterized protein n=1 Tax=Moelleriella libera RCEF 2490 TaxID=1081109 RepID=A0A168FAZ1_9HYPO|nr:hypothetical protein AAL_02243 [Moelleriella libera RCEF 2490]
MTTTVTVDDFIDQIEVTINVLKNHTVIRTGKWRMPPSRSEQFRSIVFPDFPVHLTIWDYRTALLTCDRSLDIEINLTSCEASDFTYLHANLSVPASHPSSQSIRLDGSVNFDFENTAGLALGESIAGDVSLDQPKPPGPSDDPPGYFNTLVYGHRDAPEDVVNFLISCESDSDFEFEFELELEDEDEPDPNDEGAPWTGPSHH